MTSPRITFTYSAPTADSLDLLQIEQSDWSTATGRVSKGGMFRSLREMLYGEDAGQQVDCGFTSGSVVCLIDVYPLEPGLAYQFAASYGFLSDRYEETAVETELLNFSLVDTVTPSHPAREIQRAEWVDEVYDSEGNILAPPQLTIVGDEIRTPLPVYGAVEATYTTERHSYTLTISRRTDAVDNFYTAAVYGWYDGGVDWLVLEMPPGIEAFNLNADAVCGWSGSSSAEFEEPNGGDQPVSADRETVLDYCTQEVVEDSLA